jgi:hypothetical protein
MTQGQVLKSKVLTPGHEDGPSVSEDVSEDRELVTADHRELGKGSRKSMPRSFW